MASNKNNQGVGILVIAAIVLWFAFKSDNKSEKSTSMSQSGTSTAHVYTPPANQALDISEQPPQPQNDAPLPTKYVAADRLNVRNAPNGKVITSLKRGQSITIYQESDNWAKITPGNQSSQWVSIKSLCHGDKCYQKSRQAPAPKQPVYRPTPKRNVESDAGCPCSSGRICIGPRGGRYCITSGGNKRYGV
ncbi:SH3 domain-containing protein [Serratia sp. PAMC26656]|uniref:SH3 domain-containing protein n=1 Tax=Serratia sp. PAMC26656 TaxID=2775909 RepID=UPI0018F6475A|nr:SH3 domain-containing protein [Serratia sp. PAMC26656]MBJ7892464.1 SH3 domain-containing protein [Serratia sp. PAMC26656]